MENNNILFAYRCSSADCCEEGIDDDGFSITIYEDGKAEYKTYIFSNIIKKHKTFNISQKLIKEIKSILLENNEKISAFDTDIDNGSYDGDFNKFIFNDKEIITLNISTYDIEKTKNKNPEYYHEYYNVMLQENEIMKIFNQICLILKQSHIKLNLNNIYIPFYLKIYK